MNFEGRLTLGSKFKMVETKNGKRFFSGSAWEGYKKDKTKDEWSYGWFNIKIFGETAERAEMELEKGSKFNCTGWVGHESWDDKTTGEKRTGITLNIKRYDLVQKENQAPSVTTEEVPW